MHNNSRTVKKRLKIQFDPVKCGGSEKESIFNLEVIWVRVISMVEKNYSDFSYSLLAFAHTVESKKGTKIRWSTRCYGK